MDLHLKQNKKTADSTFGTRRKSVKKHHSSPGYGGLSMACPCFNELLFGDDALLSPSKKGVVDF